MQIDPRKSYPKTKIILVKDVKGIQSGLPEKSKQQPPPLNPKVVEESENPPVSLPNKFGGNIDIIS